MAKVITLAQLKGGSGKTTTSAHIAGILSMNATALIIDTDIPQFSLSHWFNSGEEKKNIFLEQVKNVKDLTKTIEKYESKVDYIIVDLAPRLEDLTKAGIALSDITLVPVNTDLVEIWALDLTMPLLKEAQKNISGFKYFVIANKYRPHLSSHTEVKEQIEKQFDCPVLDSYIGLRTTFPKAIGDGQIVSQSRPKNQSAINEMNALVAEILTHLE